MKQPAGTLCPGQSAGIRQKDLRKAAGFTLLEAVATLLIVAILAMSLVQSLHLALIMFRHTSRQWHAALELWNRANRFQATLQAPEAQVVDTVIALQPSRPLLRLTLREQTEAVDLQWEVFRAR